MHGIPLNQIDFTAALQCQEPEQQWPRDVRHERVLWREGREAGATSERSGAEGTDGTGDNETRVTSERSNAKGQGSNSSEACVTSRQRSNAKSQSSAAVAPRRASRAGAPAQRARGWRHERALLRRGH